ncbi:MAG: hypothetical protein IID30_04295 [Planctomycetes bacterium]|nr:hypothetical protein [Planctomycetota bacterium]
MITKCIAGFGMTAGIVGLMAFSPLQVTPSDVPIPPTAPDPVPAAIATSASPAMVSTVTPMADEVPVAAGIFSPNQATKPRRVSKEIRQKTQDIKKALSELKKVLEQADSTYEKNEIRDRILELKDVLKSIQENAPMVSRVFKAKRNSDASELRKRLSVAKRKIAELHEQGRYDEAADLKAEVEQATARAKQAIAARQADRNERVRATRSGGAIRVRDDGELKEKLAVARQKITELQEQGRHEEAAALIAEVEHAAARARKSIAERWMRSQARPPRADRQSPPEPGRPPRAERAPRPRRADRPEPEPRPRHAPGPNRQGVPDSDQQLHEMMNRIEHMMRAAENLEAAGMMEQAHELRAHAHQMEQKVHEEMQQRQRNAFRERGPGGGDHNLAREVDELRREVRELREIVHQIHRKVEELSDDWN